MKIPTKRKAAGRGSKRWQEEASKGVWVLHNCVNCLPQILGMNCSLIKKEVCGAASRRVAVFVAKLAESCAYAPWWLPAAKHLHNKLN